MKAIGVLKVLGLAYKVKAAVLYSHMAKQANIRLYAACVGAQPKAREVIVTLASFGGSRNIHQPRAQYEDTILT